MAPHLKNRAKSVTHNPRCVNWIGIIPIADAECAQNGIYYAGWGCSKAQGARSVLRGLGWRLGCCVSMCLRNFFQLHLGRYTQRSTYIPGQLRLVERVEM